MTLSQELTLCFALFCRYTMDMLMQISGLYLNVPVLIIYGQNSALIIQGKFFFSKMLIFRKYVANRVLRTHALSISLISRVASMHAMSMRSWL